MYGIFAVALFAGALTLALGTFAHMAGLYRHKALAALLGQHQSASHYTDRQVYRRVRPERGSITLRAPSGPERIAWTSRRFTAPRNCVGA